MSHQARHLRVRMSMLMTLIALGSTAANAQSNAPPSAAGVGIVKVEGGQVSGVATDVGGVQLFKGIPFAGSTAGKNRFRAPQPVEPWEGVRKADSWGDQTMQDITINPVGGFWGDEFYFDPAFMPKASESGLNLNIFTPAKTAGDKLPVYVWIHGGGNDHGYASEIEFYASKLAAQGVIVVPIQYRVGVFGYLSLAELSKEDPDGISGNYGSRDIIKALQWVKENIAGFGGDPAQVTIGGQSAGSTNVAAMLRSPLAKGLFKRAVIESTTSMLPQPFPAQEEREKKNAAAIEDIFGKPMSLADLRAVPAEDYLTKKTKSGATLYNALKQAVMTPPFTLDGKVFTKETVNIIRPGALDGIDVMIGGTSDELTSLSGPLPSGAQPPDGTMTTEEFDKAMQAVYGDAYKKVYRPSDPRDAYRMYLRSQADYRIQASLIAAEYIKRHNQDSDVFAFYFNHRLPGRNTEFYGSFHSSDLWYFFNSLREAPGHRGWTGADYRMAETMSTYLANFVKTGNPNGAGLPEWQQPVKSTAFMRFADGYAYPVSSTPYPERDALNRATVLKKNNMTEADLSQ